ncbi:S8 family peptidase [Ramlibacter alkalitolerans]|uniref:S8 family peptidase n=1 Tax=Ramlibacter alkalitolerans TaxID=2039631 RepID=A0ABS1JUF0_9BURK|nr:S8 family peptidase [Ramlibacter alkalitolerans]MBL0427842.1 S8 family peptidase [Ramlibacter alkalitolerans]
MSLAIAATLALASAAAAAQPADEQQLSEDDASAAATAPTRPTTTTPPPPPPLPVGATRAEFNARQSQPWLNRINLPYASALGKADGTGVLVGVVDSGVKADHLMLKGQVAMSYDTYTRTSTVTDKQGHGTHVASTIAGTLANGATYQGVAPGAKLAIARVFDTGGATNAVINSGIDWTVKTGAPIINMSIGANKGVTSWDYSAVQRGVKAGALFTISAGNDSLKDANVFAKAANQSWANNQVIVVGALNYAGTDLASFSNWCGTAKYNCVVAPGETVLAAGIASTSAGAYYSGTSMAAPMVAGQAALIKSKWQYLKAKDISGIIYSTATRMGKATDKVPDDKFGWGLINIDKSLQPVGGLSAVTVGGTSIGSNGVTLGTGTGALTAPLKLAASGGTFKMSAVDSFGRDFDVDPGSQMPGMQPMKLANAFDAVDRLTGLGSRALDSQGSRFQLAAYESGKAFGQVSGATGFAGGAMVKKFANGTEFAASSGGGNVFFGLAGTDLKGAPAFSANATSDAYFALVPSANSVGFAKSFDSGLKVKVGLASSGEANQLAFGDIQAVRSNFSNVELSKSFGGTSVVGVAFGNVNEKNAFLGTQLGSAFAIGGPARTSVTTVSAAHKLAEGLAVAGYFSQGSTAAVSNVGNSLVTGVTATKSRAFGFGLVAADAFRSNDRLTVGFSSPLKTTSGTMHLNMPSGMDSEGNLLREARSVNLAAGARELSFETNYSMPLSAASNVATTVTLRHNAGGVAGQRDAMVAVRYTLQF